MQRNDIDDSSSQSQTTVVDNDGNGLFDSQSGLDTTPFSSVEFGHDEQVVVEQLDETKASHEHRTEETINAGFFDQICNQSAQEKKEKELFDITRCVQKLWGMNIRREQAAAIRRVMITRGDLIVIAKTGWGKSILFQAAPLICQQQEPGIALIIMSIRQLENEQCDRINCIENARAIVLNGDNNTQSLRRSIGNGYYTHG